MSGNLLTSGQSIISEDIEMDMDIGAVDLISQTDADEDFYNPDSAMPSLQTEKIAKPLDTENFLSNCGGTTIKCSGQCQG